MKAHTTHVRVQLIKPDKSAARDTYTLLKVWTQNWEEIILVYLGTERALYMVGPEKAYTHR